MSWKDRIRLPEGRKRIWLVAGVVGLLALGGLGLWALKTPDKEEEKPVQPASAADTSLINLATCRICGYRAIGPDTLLCPVCSVELTEAERINWEYSTMAEMIRQEQGNFFADEGFRDPFSFSQPETWEVLGLHFRKDTSWRPVIDEGYVRRLRDTLIDVGVIDLKKPVQ